MVNTIDAISSALQTYIVAPMNAFGIGGLVFDVPGESIAQLQTEITDHYTEDNKALQDHQAIRPDRITLKGYVGELVYGSSGQDGSILQKLTQKLTVVSSYLPQLSAAAVQLQEALPAPSEASLPLTQAANIYAVVKNALGAVGTYSKQQNAYNYLKALRSQGILMSIQTPWEFMANMAIENITAIQEEPSAFITDFSVTFKQIRIAQTQTAAFTSINASGTGSNAPQQPSVLDSPASMQSEAITNIGIVPGVTVPYSALPGAQAQLLNGSSFHALSGIGNLFSVGQ